MASERASQRAFLGVSALLFAASTAATIQLCSGPACCSTTPMPGGWSLSTFWMPAAGQTWLVAGAAFVGMWFVMMVAMMLPSITPALMNYRRQGGDAGQTALVAGGYFFVWTLFGIILYPIGAMLANLAMRNESLSRVLPLAMSIVLLLAGLNQFAPWKARQLGCCRHPPPAELSPGTAWRYGLRLGGHCVGCCLGFMLILTVLGAMDLTAMFLVTIGITLERIMPNPVRIARTTGSVIVVAGLFMSARAIGLI